MSRKYSFEDVNTEERPRIARCDRMFGKTSYSWQCTGRGSEGFGATPTQAYDRWLKNWRRRFNFYGVRERYAENVVSLFTRAPAPPAAKTKVCNRCGGEDLHWVSTDEGWRLFTPENKMHRCFKKD